MVVIGVTGSSGSGKSTVTSILESKLQALAIYSDKVVRQMQENGSEYFTKIVEVFGKEILQEDGKLDRKKIANIIFQDKTKKQKIDELTNKYIVEEIKNKINSSENKYIIIDAPLLIESKLNSICNVVIAVISQREKQIDRICKRDNIDKKTANIRLNAQKSNEFYKKYANYIVENNGGNYDKFMGRIGEIVQELQKM